MDLSFIKFLSEYTTVYWFAIIATTVALAISTRYTIKSLLKAKSGMNSELSSTKGKISRADVSASSVTELKPDASVDATDKVDDADGEKVENLSNEDEGTQGLSGRDPLDYCSHIQGEVKRVKQRVTNEKIQEKLTKDQLDEERKVQSEQLEYIFKLMEEQGEKFGVKSMDDVHQQMKLYA